MQYQQAFHPVTSVYDGLFNTGSGKLVNLLNPTEDMVDIADIAASLSKICRFGGHTKEFYSVAQHSVLVSRLCDQLPREALLHDASEAFLGDVIKPLKVLLGAGYANLETNFEAVIAARFGLNISKPAKGVVKRHDQQALKIEHQALQCGNPMILVTVMKRMGLMDVLPQYEWSDFIWQPAVAEKNFLLEFNRLFTETAII